MSDTAIPHLTRRRPSIRIIPTTSHGNWFRGRQTSELLLYHVPGTMVPRLTNTGTYCRTTTQRPRTSSIALPVCISSFGNNAPETGNPARRHKQQPIFLVCSRIFPLARSVANASSLFGLGIFHRTLQQPSSFRPFPTRQNNPAAPPSPKRLVSTEHLFLCPFHRRRGAPAKSSSSFSTLTCY